MNVKMRGVGSKGNGLLFISVVALTILMNGLYIYWSRNEMFISAEVEHFHLKAAIFLNLVLMVMLAALMLRGVTSLVQKIRGKTQFVALLKEHQDFYISSLKDSLKELESRSNEMTIAQVEDLKKRIFEINAVMKEYVRLNSQGKRDVNEGIRHLLRAMEAEAKMILLHLDESRVSAIKRKVNRLNG